MSEQSPCSLDLSGITRSFCGRPKVTIASRRAQHERRNRTTRPLAGPVNHRAWPLAQYGTRYAVYVCTTAVANSGRHFVVRPATSFGPLVPTISLYSSGTTGLRETMFVFQEYIRPRRPTSSWSTIVFGLGVVIHVDQQLESSEMDPRAAALCRCVISLGLTACEEHDGSPRYGRKTHDNLHSNVMT